MICVLALRRLRGQGASMRTCRSSAGCQRPAGHGRFGTFCEEHAAALAALRSAHFTADGTARPHAVAPAEQGPSTEDDALRIALEVQRTGRVARHVLQEELGFPYARFRRAVELAGRREWIVAGRALSPGEIAPPRQYPTDVPAERGTAVSAGASV